jgi:hypothetical protein
VQWGNLTMNMDRLTDDQIRRIITLIPLYISL